MKYRVLEPSYFKLCFIFIGILIFVAFNYITSGFSSGLFRFILSSIGTYTAFNYLKENIAKLGLVRSFLDGNTYEERLANGYRWSIKEAIITEHPNGVVYILNNTLQQLDSFGINFQPYQHGSYGFPNKTNLKEVIVMAKDLDKEWESISSTDRSKAMALLRDRIKQEDIWLNYNDFKISNRNRKRDIYYFSYTHHDSGKYEQGIDHFTAIINNNPESDNAYFSRALYLYHQGEYGKSLNDYRKTIALNPKQIGAYINIGLVYYELGDIEKAAGQFKQAIDLKFLDRNSLLESKFGLAVCLYSLGQQQQANALAKLVLRTDKRFYNINFLIEDLHWKGEIITTCKKLIQIVIDEKIDEKSIQVISSKNGNEYDSFERYHAQNLNDYQIESSSKTNDKTSIELSFEIFLKQNPGLEYFSEDQQRNAYDKYISSL